MLTDMAKTRIPNEQQFKFISSYIGNGGNAVRAYTDAGYEINKNARIYAYNLLQRPYIQIALNNQLALIENHTKTKILVNLDTMTEKVADLAERCHKAGDRANELAAYTLLMRSRGLLTDNVVLGDVERLDQIDRKILKDAKIFSAIAIPKLLTNNTVPDAVSISDSNTDNGCSNGNNEVSSNYDTNVAKTQHTDAIMLPNSNAPAQPIQPALLDTSPEQPTQEEQKNL